MATTLEQDFDIELNRLISRGLDNEDLEIARRYYSDKERQSMPASAFCGPGRSFPVTSQEDVTNAAGLAGHADNPDAVRACIKRKAKANGWSLPKSWTDGKDRAMEADATFMYVPITRIDDKEWTVEGQATSDAIDSYGTIFDYESSKKAFQQWRGNIREMHDSTKAVGRAIEVTPDNDNHAIIVKARISRGARDTWEKVLDGTLSGFSIGVPKGKYKVKEVQRNGKNVPMYYDHELAEVSLVDNPGSPGCNIAVVRADGVATEVLDDTTEETPAPDVTRAGARISHATQSDLHSLRDGHLKGAQKTMGLCGCDECMTGGAAMDPDGDGDIDMVGSLDTDGDGGKPGSNGHMNYALASSIERQMQPFVTRVQAMLSQHAARPIQPITIEHEAMQPMLLAATEPIERRIADVERAFDTKLTEVRSLLSEAKELLVKIAAQPAPGGPIMTPVDKRLATSPQPTYNTQDDIAALSRAAQLMPNMTQEDQIALAAEIIKRQNRG